MLDFYTKRLIFELSTAAKYVKKHSKLATFVELLFDNEIIIGNSHHSLAESKCAGV